MKWSRRQRQLLLALTVIGSIVILDHYRRNNASRTTRRPHGNQKGCQLPHPDPYDPSILKYIFKPPPLECKGLQYEFTYLTDDEFLHLNKTAMEKSSTAVTCFYRCFDRADGDDFQLNYGEWIEISAPVKPGCEFVETYCKKASFPGTTVYHNNHNQILEKGKKAATRTSTRKSVNLLVIDSVSHSNFIRNLPKSLEILNSMYKSYIFEGMSKVGDNSYPNAVAFLAAKTRAEFGDAYGYFDDRPLIWKDFAQAGYETLYAEDFVDFNLFTYLAKGFQTKPADHYLRPFFLNIYGSYLHRRSKYLCYGNQAIHNIEFNYLSQFLRKNKGLPKFGLSWFNEMSHEYLNTVNVADEDLAKFLRTHYDDLKESFFFLFSDHGHRFDPIRRTPIGRIEEAFPFFSMHIPNSLQETLPQLDKVVRGNTKVLTSFWDLYVTMRDILDLSKSDRWKELNVQLSGDRWKHNYSVRGESLLRPIRDRNCKEAEVPEEYCMCYYENPVDVNSELISQIGNALITHLNRLLKPYKQCAVLEMSRVHHAARIEDELSDAGTRYRLTVEAKPSAGIFEGVIKYDGRSNISSVHGNVNRVNSYGNQSICLKEAELRKFCYCIVGKVYEFHPSSTLFVSEPRQ